MSALTCARCGVADETVARADNGIPRHEAPMKCIAALKLALARLQEHAACAPF